MFPSHAPTPTYYGWGTKEGGRFHTWKRRWFVFVPPYIEYYKFPNAGFIKKWDITTSVVEPTPFTKWPNAFTITTPDRRLVICPDKPEDRDVWIRKIRVFIILHHMKASYSDFEQLRLLGRGSSGSVWAVRHRTTRSLYAMKTMAKSQIPFPDLIEQAFAERDALFELKHPFLVGASFCFQTETQLCFVMEYVPGGAMSDRLDAETKFPEDQARLYLAELVLAIGELHASKRIHRDVKSDNILFDANGHVKVADFGLVRGNMGAGMTATTICGTGPYMAPELIAEIPYTKSVDWWALGILAFEMLCGYFPFNDANVARMEKKIMEDDIAFPAEISPAAKDLISRLCTKTMKDRLGAGPRGTEDVKAHPFFRGIDWAAVLNRRFVMPWLPPVEFGQRATGGSDGGELAPDSPVSESVDAMFKGFSVENAAIADAQVDGMAPKG
jgi:serine/threonine protein kinase